MTIEASPVGVDHMLEGRMLCLLTLHTKYNIEGKFYQLLCLIAETVKDML